MNQVTILSTILMSALFIGCTGGSGGSSGKKSNPNKIEQAINGVYSIQSGFECDLENLETRKIGTIFYRVDTSELANSASPYNNPLNHRIYRVIKGQAKVYAEPSVGGAKIGFVSFEKIDSDLFEGYKTVTVKKKKFELSAKFDAKNNEHHIVLFSESLKKPVEAVISHCEAAQRNTLMDF